jgi:hypothetical protein
MELVYIRELQMCWFPSRSGSYTFQVCIIVNAERFYFVPDYVMAVKMKTLATENSCNVIYDSNHDNILVYITYNILVCS